MTTTKSAPNGARAKILRALISEGMLTTAELATHTGLKPDQARDNAVQARREGMLTSERDDVTGLVAYKVTAKGREYCAVNEPHASAPEIAPPIEREQPAVESVAADIQPDISGDLYAVIVDCAPYASLVNGLEKSKVLALEALNAGAESVVVYRLSVVGVAKKIAVFEAA